MMITVTSYEPKKWVTNNKIKLNKSSPKIMSSGSKCSFRITNLFSRLFSLLTSPTLSYANPRRRISIIFWGHRKEWECAYFPQVEKLKKKRICFVLNPESLHQTVIHEESVCVQEVQTNFQSFLSPSPPTPPPVRASEDYLCTSIFNLYLQRPGCQSSLLQSKSTFCPAQHHLCSPLCTPTHTHYNGIKALQRIKAQGGTGTILQVSEMKGHARTAQACGQRALY